MPDHKKALFYSETSLPALKKAPLELSRLCSIWPLFIKSTSSHFWYSCYQVSAITKIQQVVYHPTLSSYKNTCLSNHLAQIKILDPFEKTRRWGGARNEISSHNKTTIKQDSFAKQRSTCDFSTGKKIWMDQKPKIRLQSKHNIQGSAIPDMRRWATTRKWTAEVVAKTVQHLDVKCD